MKIIDERTVELTVEEEMVYQQFDAYLDRGLSIPHAAVLALNMHYAVESGQYARGSGAFASWLSESTVERWGSRYRSRRPRW
jgi:hypothetical protein